MDCACAQNVLLFDRKRLEISGVVDVREFSEISVEITLDDGYLGVDGNDLKIMNFSSDSGNILITGTVDAITYYTRALSCKKRKKKN